MLFAGVAIAAYVQLAASSTTAADLSSTASDETTEELMQWCKGGLPVAAMPTSIMLLPGLPMSAGGKLMRGGLPHPPWAAESTSVTCPAVPEDTCNAVDMMSHSQTTRLLMASRTPTDNVRTVSETKLGDISTASHKALCNTETPALPSPGDVDPHALPRKVATAQNRRLPEGLEGKILGLFREALGLPRLEPCDDFFRAGGGSLAAAGVANALLIQPDVITACPTARKLAAALRPPPSPASHNQCVAATGVSSVTHAFVGPAGAHSSTMLLPDQVKPDKPPQLPMLTLSRSAVATAGGDEAWQWQAQRALAVGSQAGGWRFERAGGLRWGGKGLPANLPQSPENIPHSQSAQSQADQIVQLQQTGLKATHGHEPASLQTQGTCPLTGGACLKKSPERPKQLKCVWRVKLKECVDASPVVLVTSHPEARLPQQMGRASQQQQLQEHGHTEAGCGPQGLPLQPQLGDEQHGQQQQQHKDQDQLQQQNRQQQQDQEQRRQHQHQQRHDRQHQQLHQDPQQQKQQQQWVFGCSHGGDVVCVEGHSGRAVWGAVLPARAEAGLSITADCKVSLK